MDFSRSTPQLSVVVGIVSDTTSRADARMLVACLDALAKQRGGPPFEVIVPYQPGVDGIEDVQRQYPFVRFMRADDVAGGGREHHDVLKARGIHAARGHLVGLLEDHERPDSGWCAGVLAAHQQECSAVGGAIENGIDRPLNWAVYLCDFGRYQNPVPAGESSYASDANVAYKRTALEGVREFWQNSFREVVVNGALRSRGEKVILDPRVIVYQHRLGLRFGPALRERFIWGRSFAATRAASLSRVQRVLYTVLAPLLPGLLVVRMTQTARARGRHLGAFLVALPLIALLAIAWSAGETIGYAAGLPKRPADGAP